MATPLTTDSWNARNAAEHYGIASWSAGYFDINEDGDVVITSDGFPAVSLPELIAGIKERGLDMPVLLRIGDILDSRIKLLHDSFNAAIAELGYGGAYRGVYPIKVNQQQHVVEHVTRFGRAYHHGLEAGSKAELLAAISFLDDPEAYLVCNGYKDEEFVDIGLYASKMGINCLFVIEMPGELDLILDRAAALDIEPTIGIRIKLATRSEGKWAASGGDRSVFGLNVSQAMEVVDVLKQRGKLHILKMLHYHIGSQIPNIWDIRNGVQEACCVYRGLVEEGAPMGVLDLGGGLAVDYDGSQSNSNSSRNYSLEEYCADIVDTIVRTLEDTGIPHPTIITESGRATVAYYSVLLFNILDVTRFETQPLPHLPPDAPSILRDMQDALQTLNTGSLQECFNDAIFYKNDLTQRFRLGQISLRERAHGESLFWHILSRAHALAQALPHGPEELANLPELLADIYYGNFSLFQSLPDVWAIDQIFPVMPVHRLHERPTRHAIISDITCDCDGKIERFATGRETNGTVSVHELNPGEEYYMGVFLVGAYQETLGDLHNLLGDTNVVTICLNAERGYEFIGELEGDSVEDVLTYVEYEPKEMVRRMRRMAESAVHAGRITPRERREILDMYAAGLRGYTYFER